MLDLFAYKAYIASPHRSIKHTTYFQVYEQLFKPYRNKKITFVEVGVLDGGSLFMWRKFFGKKARIIGIDLNPEAKKWEKDNFEIYIGSQSDPAFWSKFSKEVGPVDLLLDDGGHRFDQQFVTLESMLDQINDGGMLVVEDTHTSYFGGFGDNEKSFVHYVKDYIDKINYRFSQLMKIALKEKKTIDHRVFSIEIFESIIAFKVNKKNCYLPSPPCTNKDGQVMSEDYSSKDPFKSINKFF